MPEMLALVHGMLISTSRRRRMSGRRLRRHQGHPAIPGSCMPCALGGVDSHRHSGFLERGIERLAGSRRLSEWDTNENWQARQHQVSEARLRPNPNHRHHEPPFRFPALLRAVSSCGLCGGLAQIVQGRTELREVVDRKRADFVQSAAVGWHGASAGEQRDLDRQ